MPAAINEPGTYCNHTNQCLPEMKSRSGSHSKTVLVVEDDDHTRVCLSKRLERQGIRPVPADTAQRALDVLDQIPVHAITLDVRLPDMDGFELAQTIRRRHAGRELPIIFIAGKAPRFFKEMCRESGGQYFLRKPYDPDALLLLLKALLAQGQSPR